MPRPSAESLVENHRNPSHRRLGIGAGVGHEQVSTSTWVPEQHILTARDCWQCSVQAGARKTCPSYGLPFSCLAQRTPYASSTFPCQLCSHLQHNFHSALGKDTWGMTEAQGWGQGTSPALFHFGELPSIMQSPRDFRSPELGSGTTDSQSDTPPPLGYELMAPPHGSPFLPPH